MRLHLKSDLCTHSLARTFLKSFPHLFAQKLPHPHTCGSRARTHTKVCILRACHPDLRQQKVLGLCKLRIAEMKEKLFKPNIQLLRDFWQMSTLCISVRLGISNICPIFVSFHKISSINSQYVFFFYFRASLEENFYFLLKILVKRKKRENTTLQHTTYQEKLKKFLSKQLKQSRLQTNQSSH